MHAYAPPLSIHGPYSLCWELSAPQLINEIKTRIAHLLLMSRGYLERTGWIRVMRQQIIRRNHTVPITKCETVWDVIASEILEALLLCVHCARWTDYETAGLSDTSQQQRFITLNASSRKRNVTVWRPSVRPSVRLWTSVLNNTFTEVYGPSVCLFVPSFL